MLALLVAVFSAMLGLGIVAPLMPLYAESLGATGIWLGAIFSGFSFARTVFMPVIGKLSDKYGRKPFLALGLLLYTFISIAYMFTTNVEQLTAVRIFHGFSSAMVIPTAMAYVSEIAPKGQEGKYMSTFNTSFLLGIGFGPIIGGFLKDLFGIKAAFCAMAALTAFAFLVVMIFVPSRRPKVKRGFRLVFDRTMNALITFRVSNAFRLAMIMAFLPVLISRFSGIQIGVIISTVILSNAVLQRFFGQLADRFDRVKLAVFGSSISTAAFLCLPLFSVRFTEVLALCLAMGVGGAISMPSVSAMAAELGRRFGHGSVMGVFNMAMGLGMAISPILAGYIVDWLGLAKAFFIMGAGSALGTALFYYLIKS